MPWGVKGKLELRLELVRRYLGGESISALSREFGVSRPTAYLWVERFERHGSTRALLDRSSRPKRSPSKISTKLESRICKLREKYSWGADKLQIFLKSEGIELSRSTVKRVIKRNGLLIAEDCHRPALKRYERSEPNELWQVDFKGPMGRDAARCEPLSMLDDHSRFVVGLLAVKTKQTPEIQEAFERIFQENGLPEAILFDHGVPWWSVSHAQGFSKFSVWLMNHDVKLVFSGVNHPQTQGKVERFHRTLAERVRTKGTPQRFSKWSKLLEEIRHEYNYIRPHESLNMSVPASRYRKSVRRFSKRPRKFDYPLGAKVVRIDQNGCFRYRDKRVFCSQALARQFVRIEELEHSLTAFYRTTPVREIDLRTGQTLAFTIF